jgi:hypothetical protein
MIKRRHLFGSLLVGASGTAAPQAPAATGLGEVAVAHGIGLTGERLRVLEPVLKNRQAQLNTLRAFAIDDNVAPTPGVTGRK